MKKQTLFFLILFIVLIFGIGFSYFTFNKQVPTTEIKDSPFSVYLQDNKEIFIENTDWYETKIIYPKDNQKVRDQIFEIWNSFAKENMLKDFTDEKSARENLGIQDSEIKYTFSAEYKIVNSENTISYVYQIYTYTGGAHGATDIFPITYNDKFEFLPIDQILPDKSLEKISTLVAADLLKQKRGKLKEFNMSEEDIEKYLQNDSWLKEGTDLTRDNYSRVWIDGDDIVISFGQYQVGPYSEGMYEVRIELNQI